VGQVFSKCLYGNSAAIDMTSWFLNGILYFTQKPQENYLGLYRNYQDIRINNCSAIIFTILILALFKKLQFC